MKKKKKNEDGKTITFIN